MRNAAMWLGWFAKTGNGNVDQAISMLEEVEGVLFRRTVDLGAVSAVLDYETEIGVVLGAARARVAIMQDRPVPVGDLAVLAGYAPSRVRGDVGKGLLRRGPAPDRGRAMDAGIVAEDARTWLEAFDRIPGFDRAK